MSLINLRDYIEIKEGSSRIVILVGNLAFKFPYWRLFRYRGYRNFLCGLLGNLTEAEFGIKAFPELAPVLFRCIGGFLIVMPRAIPLTEEEWEAFNYYNHFKNLSTDICENKKDSFGKINNKIVAVDYGG